MAARYEFEVNSDAKAARGLLQSGLRLNNEAQELWIEYLRLELLYWEKLRMRAEVLGMALSAEDEVALVSAAEERNSVMRAMQHADDNEDEEEDEDLIDAEPLVAQEAREANDFLKAIDAGVKAVAAKAGRKAGEAQPAHAASQETDVFLKTGSSPLGRVMFEPQLDHHR